MLTMGSPFSQFGADGHFRAAHQCHVTHAVCTDAIFWRRHAGDAFSICGQWEGFLTPMPNGVIILAMAPLPLLAH